MKKRIVAEITRNWGDENDTDRPLISERFETVIAVNASRGFALESWHLQVTYAPTAGDTMRPSLIETIVAVFIES